MRTPMKLSHLSILFLFLSLPLGAQATIDNDAGIVQLRTSCNEAGATINNCFTDLDTLNDWIQNTRDPGPSTPLAVNIGPGTFPGFFECKGDQHITLNGSGKSLSVLKRKGGTGLSLLVTISLSEDCNLNVNNIGINNIGGAAAIHVADTSGPDLNMKTTWNNVEVLTNGYSWLEEHCTSNNPVNNSVHFWTSSRLVSTAAPGGLTSFAKGYVSCAENWFHGTEITSDTPVSTGSNQASALLALGEIHVYGGVIRVLTGAGVTFPDPAPFSGGAGPEGIVAIYSAGDAEVHVHGTGIDVLSEEPNNIAGVLLEDGGHAHILEASFNMHSCDNTPACGGELRRIANFGGHIQSFFEWQSSTTPPNIASLDGNDSFIETDCSAADCSQVGNETHLLIYNSKCSNVSSTQDPWYDTVTHACRGGGNP